uniref:Glutathione S-transferase n=1 Tax=Aegilops tauschii TaxID=37682 RepID=M8B5I9_AEGTA
MGAQWILPRAGGRAPFSVVFFCLVRVCVLLRKTRRRRLPEDGIKVSPPSPRSGSDSSIVGRDGRERRRAQATGDQGEPARPAGAARAPPQGPELRLRVEQDPRKKNKIDDLLRHGKLPELLIHGAKPVPGSLNIMQYVDEAFPNSAGPSLIPAGSHDRAIARYWAEFIDDTVFY